MSQVVLIRPGSTEFSREGRIEGTLDLPLTEEGEAEVKARLEDLQKLGLDVVCCPSEGAARRTAELIGKGLGVKVKPIKGLHNVNHGLWQGLQLEEVRHKHPKVFRQWQEAPTTVCPPEGEMVSEAYERVRQTLGSLLKRQKDKVVGLVVPDPLSQIVRCFLKHEDLAQLRNFGGFNGNNGRYEVVEVALASAGVNSPATAEQP